MQPTAAAAVLQPHQPRQDEEAASGPSAARQDGKLWRVTLSVCIYWVSVSLVPVYNKKIFSNRVYPYPVATAAIQLGMVSAVLCVLSVLKHFVADGRRGWGKGAQRPEGYQVTRPLPLLALGENTQGALRRPRAELLVCECVDGPAPPPLPI